MALSATAPTGFLPGSGTASTAVDGADTITITVVAPLAADSEFKLSLNITLPPNPVKLPQFVLTQKNSDGVLLSEERAFESNPIVGSFVESALTLSEPRVSWFTSRRRALPAFMWWWCLLCVKC